MKQTRDIRSALYNIEGTMTRDKLAELGFNGFDKHLGQVFENYEIPERLHFTVLDDGKYMIIYVDEGNGYCHVVRVIDMLGIQQDNLGINKDHLNNLIEEYWDDHAKDLEYHIEASDYIDDLISFIEKFVKDALRKFYEYGRTSKNNGGK